MFTRGCLLSIVRETQKLLELFWDQLIQCMYRVEVMFIGINLRGIGQVAKCVVEVH